MDNVQVIQKAKQCLSDSRSLITALDESPAFVRNRPEAVQARNTATVAIELVTELLRRVRCDLQGGENGEV